MWSVVSVMAVSVWRRCKVSVIQRTENGKYFPFSRKIFRLFCRCGAAPHHRQWSSGGLLACFWIIWPSRGLECRGNDTHILRPGEAAEAATMTSAICRAVLLSKQLCAIYYRPLETQSMLLLYCAINTITYIAAVQETFAIFLLLANCVSEYRVGHCSALLVN